MTEPLTFDMDHVPDLAKTDFYSFTNVLARVTKERKPRRVIEWGTGYSTLVMLNSGAREIWTIESDPEWYMRWYSVLSQYPNVHQYRLPVDGNYCVMPLGFGFKFNQAFVDGFDDARADCIRTVAQILEPDGVLFVHDSEREYYWPPIREYFTVLENVDRTVVLELKKK